MLSNPNMIFYACIANGSIILDEFSSKEVDEIGSLARQCITEIPSFHPMFSQTLFKRTYTFLIDDPFVYFLICHDYLDKSESIWFLNSLKHALEDYLLTGLVVDNDNLTQNCLQSHFNPIFSKITTLNSDSQSKTTPSLNSRKPNEGLKKKKKSSCLKVDESDNCRDFRVSLNKSNASSLYVDGSGEDRQKAQKAWRKHVWVVLILDLLILGTLFGIWLWLCSGFQCINGSNIFGRFDS